jgi:hypothetical protein
MISDLATETDAAASSRRKHRPKGWTPERRARQAVLARRHQPWRYATGPRTAAGKARVAMNPLRQGGKRGAWLEEARRIRAAIRLCADTVLLVRTLIAQRNQRTSPAPRDVLIACQPAGAWWKSSSEINVHTGINHERPQDRRAALQTAHRHFFEAHSR